MSSGVTPDDLSFFMQPDESAWPGDSLSPAQYETAVKHFADPHACLKPWRWALISSGVWLLKGTRYLITSVPEGDGMYWPNIHYGRGYWGDGLDILPHEIPTIAVKLMVASDATNDCLHHLSMTKLAHDDLPDDDLVAVADRYEE